MITNHNHKHHITSDALASFFSGVDKRGRVGCVANAPPSNSVIMKLQNKKLHDDDHCETCLKAFDNQ